MTINKQPVHPKGVFQNPKDLVDKMIETVLLFIGILVILSPCTI